MGTHAAHEMRTRLEHDVAEAALAVAVDFLLLGLAEQLRGRRDLSGHHVVRRASAALVAELVAEGVGARYAHRFTSLSP